MTIPTTGAEQANPSEHRAWTAGEIAIAILAAVVLALLLWLAYRGTGDVGTGMF